jgi:hypothetical protein
MIKVPQHVLPTYKMMWESKACLMEEINCMALKILSYKLLKNWFCMLHFTMFFRNLVKVPKLKGT